MSAQRGIRRVAAASLVLRMLYSTTSGAAAAAAVHTACRPPLPACSVAPDEPHQRGDAALLDVNNLSNIVRGSCPGARRRWVLQPHPLLLGSHAHPCLRRALLHSSPAAPLHPLARLTPAQPLLPLTPCRRRTC